MQLNLVPHPDTPPSGTPFKVWANIDHAASLGAVASTNIWFGIGAPASRFILSPASEEPARSDRLWERTCLEAWFREPGSEAYREWNFAPSGDWAAYDFNSHRRGRSDPDVRSPYIRMEDNMTWWALGATISVDADRHWQLGLSAILEERDGTKSYWALAHPESGDPDFHDPACFTAHLP